MIRGNSFVRASNKRTRHTYSRGTYVPARDPDGTIPRGNSRYLETGSTCRAIHRLRKIRFQPININGRSPFTYTPLIERTGPIVGNGWFTANREVSSCRVIIPTSLPPPPDCRDSVPHSIENHRPFFLTTIIVNFRPFFFSFFFLFFLFPGEREHWSKRDSFTFFSFLFIRLTQWIGTFEETKG